MLDTLPPSLYYELLVVHKDTLSYHAKTSPWSCHNEKGVIACIIYSADTGFDNGFLMNCA